MVPVPILMPHTLPLTPTVLAPRVRACLLLMLMRLMMMLLLLVLHGPCCKQHAM
jgi:hypothetical protein